MITPETLTRHELNGLHVSVVEARNPDLVGIAGRVVVETMRTLHVDCGAASGDTADGDRNARVRQLPKQGTTLEFRLPASRTGDDASPGTDEAAGRGRKTADPGTARGAREGPGTTSKLGSETAGRTGQSGRVADAESATRDRSDDDSRADDCGDGVAYVTVDGDRLLSRPALRTENTGVSRWR